MVHLNIQIRGRVQGVYYRASACRRAEELGLTGFVRNQADGSVYAEAEGTEEAVEAFVEWCRQGPPLAQVQEVRAERGELQAFRGFEIRR